jgi:hypothetical protein
MTQDKQWLVPLSGLAFVAMMVAGFALAGDTPDPKDDSASQITRFYADGKGHAGASVVVVAIAVTLLVVFAAYVRRELAGSDGTGSIPGSLVLAGATVLAGALAFDATVNLALAETADHIGPAAVQALSALYTNDHIPFGVGLAIMMLGVGIGAVRNGLVAKPLGWVAVTGAVLTLTPAGNVTFPLLGLMLVVVSVALALRARPSRRSVAPKVAPAS